MGLYCGPKCADIMRGELDIKRLPNGYPYKEEGWLDVLPKTNVTLVAGNGMNTGMVQTAVSIEVGEQYRVTWDGFSYIVEGKEKVTGDFITQNLGNMSLFGEGDDNTGEPFVLYVMAGIPILMCVGATEGEHTFTIAKLSSVTHRINPEFLPDGYPYKAIEKTALVENMNVVPSYNAPSSYEVDFEFAVGQTYTVEWNGETFECVATFLEGLGVIGNRALLGDSDDTGEPFAMSVNGGNLRILGEGENVTLSIYGSAEKIYQMDEAFMPLLTSPNGTKYKLTVADDGTLSAVKV